MTAVKWLFAGGEFFLNFLIAAIVTDIVASPFHFQPSRNAIGTYVLRKDCLDAAAAFCLGYFVYRRWKWNSAMWVWVVGLCWLGQRTALYWFTQHGPLSGLHGSWSVYEHMSGFACAFDSQSCWDWAVYALLFLRTTFYSAGAFLCLLFRRHESAALPNLKKAILALRR
jgi:hypothetical protein